MGEFVWPVRVYYEDTDAGGVVYYANYLKFMERGRTEMLRARGFEQDRIRDEDQALFAVRRVEVGYLKPALFNDQLHVHTQVAEIRRASFMFAQQIKRGDDLLCTGRIQVVCVHTARFTPRSIPERILQEMRHAE